MNREKLKAQLRLQEGDVPYAYQDSLGYWTIGVGHLIDKRLGGKLHPRVIDLQLEIDIDAAHIDAAADPWFSDLDDVRQNVVVNLVFNMGKERWAQFVNTKAAFARKDFEAAAQGLEKSKWYTQVGNRAKTLVRQLRTGEYQ